VAYNIPEILNSRKAQDIFLIMSVLLLSGISFGLGRLSVTQHPLQPVTLQQAQLGTVTMNTATQPLQSAEQASKKQYVASKNGTVYHAPWCSGAQRIREDNKVWFATKKEAEGAGYRPAKNCKGL